MKKASSIDILIKSILNTIDMSRDDNEIISLANMIIKKTKIRFDSTYKEIYEQYVNENNSSYIIDHNIEMYLKKYGDKSLFEVFFCSLQKFNAKLDFVYIAIVFGRVNNKNITFAISEIVKFIKKETLSKEKSDYELEYYNKMLSKILKSTPCKATDDKNGKKIIENIDEIILLIVENCDSTIGINSKFFVLRKMIYILFNNKFLDIFSCTKQFLRFVDLLIYTGQCGYAAEILEKNVIDEKNGNLLAELIARNFEMCLNNCNEPLTLKNIREAIKFIKRAIITFKKNNISTTGVYEFFDQLLRQYEKKLIERNEEQDKSIH